MQRRIAVLVIGATTAAAIGAAAAPAATAWADPAQTPVPPTPLQANADVDVADARVDYLEDLDLLVFGMDVKGTAGGTKPGRRGTLEGARVLAYLFPTTLAPADVGFAGGDGIVTLAVTTHPDFDDTPLWDESGNGRADDDGAEWHAHWLLLERDESVRGELRVKEKDGTATPPTAPDLAAYVDSPGFPVLLRGTSLRVLVPAQRVRRNTDFRFDAATAYLQLSTVPGAPTLGVYELYDVRSGDLKLPFKVTRR